jgi:ABC-2 type transport system permease protein
VVLAPAAIVGGLTLALYGDTPARALWLRATLLAACYFAYFAVFVAITLAVSARAATARSALTILLTFWVITVLLAPPLVLSAAARRSPTPTAVELAGNLQRARADGPLYFERLITVEDRLRQEYQVAAVEQLPVNPEGVAMFEEEADEGAVQDAHFRQLFEVYRQQNALFQLGSAISPLVAVQALSMNLSGTSLEHHLHFAEAAENYRRTFVQLMNRAIADAALPANSQSIAVQRGQDLWEATPRFVYSPPGLDTLASWSVIAIASLAAWLFAIAAFSALALRRFSRNAI